MASRSYRPTLRTAEWANITIAASDTTEEIDKLRRGGDGHIVAWSGVSLWRSLLQLDLIDEFRLDLHSYTAGEGTRLFDDVPRCYRLDPVSTIAESTSKPTTPRGTARPATYRRRSNQTGNNGPSERPLWLRVGLRDPEVNGGAFRAYEHSTATASACSRARRTMTATAPYYRASPTAGASL
jgi:hypothetical protein